jgi:hypothetical protein
LDVQSVITRTVRVAGGRFAPGHLELTQQVPFEMVDVMLAATGGRFVRRAGYRQAISDRGAPVSFALRGGRIGEIWVMRNPDKLTTWNP